MTTQNRLFAITHQKLGKPKKLPLGALSVDPERFQVRCGESNNIVDKALRERAVREVIVELKEVVQAGKLLDPLLVWKDTVSDTLVVFDGHHRMDAYQAAEAKPALEVWTQQLNVNTEEEVRKFSYDLNSRVHLYMPQAEKQEATWRAIVTGEAVGSLRAIAHAYGISKSQVDLMKAKMKVLLPICNVFVVLPRDHFLRCLHFLPQLWRFSCALESALVNQLSKDLIENSIRKYKRKVIEFRFSAFIYYCTMKHVLTNATRT